MKNRITILAARVNLYQSYWLWLFCICLFAYNCRLNALDSVSTAKRDQSSILQQQIAQAKAEFSLDAKLTSSLTKLPPVQQVDFWRDLTTAHYRDVILEAINHLADLIYNTKPQTITATNLQKAKSSLNTLTTHKDVAVQTAALFCQAQYEKKSSAQKAVTELLSKTDTQQMAVLGLTTIVTKHPTTAKFLLAILENPETPAKVSEVIIKTAGKYQMRGFLPVIFKKLADDRPYLKIDQSNYRVCDAAVLAIEAIYSLPVNRSFLDAEISVKNKSVQEWQAWAKTVADVSKINPAVDLQEKKTNDAIQTFMSRNSTDEERQAAKMFLETKYKKSLCLALLPGIDVIVAPSLQQLLRIVNALGPDDSSELIQNWSSLTNAVRDKLDSQKLSKLPLDQQAAWFIELTWTEQQKAKHFFYPEWIWHFCQTFVQEFPDSPELKRVTACQRQLVESLQQNKQHIVMHGLHPLVEPLPQLRQSANGGMQAFGLTGLHDLISAEPSVWEHYRNTVDLLAKRADEVRSKGEVYEPSHYFKIGFIRQFRSNSWPVLGQALLEIKVNQNPVEALKMVNIAIGLNPVNAKAYVVKAYILCKSKPVDKDGAAKNLQTALELDAQALADEGDVAKLLNSILR